MWGVLNVTPDSFSDGGRFDSTDRAVEHARKMHAQGADVIDVGGESTRPGAGRITVEQELQRVIPVIEVLAREGVAVSIDTMRSQVAAAAVESGAVIVNDVSGGLADPKMHSVVAELDVPYVIMHWRGHSDRMEELAVYEDPVRQVCEEVEKRVHAAELAGIERIIVDPGIGFAKDSAHNWALLRSIDHLVGLGRPILVGASRKRFLGALLADQDGHPRDADGRDVASAALSALLAFSTPLWGLRVHDVQATVDAVKVAHAMKASEGET